MNNFSKISKINKLFYLVVLIVLTACASSESKKPDQQGKWAIQLADAAIARNDSLAIYNNPSSIRWQYDLGMLGQAIEQLEATDVRYFNYNKNYINLFVNNDGTIATYKPEEYNLDNYSVGKSLLSLYKKTGEEKYKKAIELMMHQLQTQPRTSNGGYCHKGIYNHQIWLNSAYMLEPFLARYAHDFNQPEWFDTVSFQLINTYSLTLDKSDGLMVHAWDESRKQNWADPVTGKSPNKWGRAIGWYMMGLVDVLEYMPIDHPQRKELENILQEVSQAVLKVRDKESGLWYQILDKGNQEYNYIETSCSAMFVYAFAKGANLGVLPVKYKDIAGESFNSLTSRSIKTDLDDLPTVTHICGSAGLGYKIQRDGSFEYYINQQQIDNDPKGVAPIIFAAIELNK